MLKSEIPGLRGREFGDFAAEDPPTSPKSAKKLQFLALKMVKREAVWIHFKDKKAVAAQVASRRKEVGNTKGDGAEKISRYTDG